MHWFNGWQMGWMMIAWLLGPVLIALLVWALLRSGREPGGSPESPEQVVKQRYAKGEIDRETYVRMLSDLKSGGLQR